MAILAVLFTKNKIDFKRNAGKFTHPSFKAEGYGYLSPYYVIIGTVESPEKPKEGELKNAKAIAHVAKHLSFGIDTLDLISKFEEFSGDKEADLDMFPYQGNKESTLHRSARLTFEAMRREGTKHCLCGDPNYVSFY
jgi:hypothetical protein